MNSGHETPDRDVADGQRAGGGETVRKTRTVSPMRL